MKPVPPSAASNRQNANKNNSGSQGKVPGGPSHEEMVAELRSKNEPLNINGEFVESGSSALALLLSYFSVSLSL